MIDYSQVTVEEFENLTESQRKLVPMARKMELLNGAEKPQSKEVEQISDEDYELRMYGMDESNPNGLTREQAEAKRAKAKDAKAVQDSRRIIPKSHFR